MNDEDILKQIPGLPASERDILNKHGSRDDDASSEAKLLTQGLSAEEIEKISAHNEHNRTEKFRNHFENIAICLLYSGAILFGTLGFAWFWHLLAPICWRWLDPDGIGKVQNLVTGGIIASLAAGHIKRRLS